MLLYFVFLTEIERFIKHLKNGQFQLENLLDSFNDVQRLANSEIGGENCFFYIEQHGGNIIYDL